MPIPEKKPRWVDKLIQARKKTLGLNQVEFAEAIGTTQSNVSKWEKGLYRPTPDVFVKIAGLLPGPEKFFFWEEAGLPSEYFMGTAAKTMPTALVQATAEIVEVNPGRRKTDQLPKVEAVLVPLLADAIAAGNPRGIDDSDVKLYIPVLAEWLPANGQIVAVTVAGDSMSPLVNEGYLAFINIAEREPKRLIGRMIAARHDGGVTLKWLRKSGSQYLLVPQNVSPRHEVFIMDAHADSAIIGEVVQWTGRPTPRKK